MEYKIAIIGSLESIQGFQALGVTPHPVQNPEHAGETIDKIIAANETAVIFITEDWADKIKDYLAELPSRALPAIVPIPSHQGSTGAGLRNISKIVEQAVGSDILKET
ncbi:MAG: V-type ATP synthase subunit F [Candidatus Buchananbacteria bacterium CG10_big_fil_rev_8_21_14_0_10_42_9]|uniref:V-type ATP synthase subunit F n=1 Tax=Candidatus Buchananbacteria bacterium CG10_big_fil_rev_8_21_14_0_10_42_9 TaxID=1974526 RepID=A0A2H0W0W1_9BACT|nr:MAG: V-type ATP synthase subunit F [Candidatus Buchananbacteria bacterium CG10_big_fil_rev_8_21_14_0_10_42_9]